MLATAVVHADREVYLARLHPPLDRDIGIELYPGHVVAIADIVPVIFGVKLDLGDPCLVLIRQLVDRVHVDIDRRVTRIGVLYAVDQLLVS